MSKSPKREVSPKRALSPKRPISPSRRADINDLNRKFGELETMWQETLERSTPRTRRSRSSSLRNTPSNLSRLTSQKGSFQKSVPAGAPAGASAAEVAEMEFLERVQKQQEVTAGGGPPAVPSGGERASHCWKCGLDLTSAKAPPKFCRECGSRLV